MESMTKSPAHCRDMEKDFFFSFFIINRLSCWIPVAIILQWTTLESHIQNTQITDRAKQNLFLM